MIEAMACGTPVIAWPCGSVPEVVDDGVSGFLVDDIDAAAAAVRKAAHLNRRRIRAVYEARFSAEAMGRAYVRVYERLKAGEAMHSLDVARPHAPPMAPAGVVAAGQALQRNGRGRPGH